MTVIKINALDTLYFRDGKPFTMGEDTWANGMFPPYPSVFFGALRSCYFSYNIDQLDKANSKNDPTNSLNIKSVALLVNDKLHFPLPLDILIDEENNTKAKEAYSLKMRKIENSSIVSNYPTSYILEAQKNNLVGIENGIIAYPFFNAYLDGESELMANRLSDFITIEPKTGIGINKVKRNSDEGKLYRIDMMRPESNSYLGKNNKISFLVEYEGLEIPSSGFMKLGGEGKSVYYEKVENNVMEEIKLLKERRLNEKSKMFKILFITPTIFNQGWLPEWINKDTLIGVYNGIKLKLLTAAIGKHISIGGFDIKERRPKKMKRAVPAGSVYYFEILNDIDTFEIYKNFHYQKISEESKAQGFGLSLVGGITR